MTASNSVTASNSGEQNVVVVHRGARDAYQVARALKEAGMLERLVTDLYWPAQAQSAWANQLGGLLPGAWRRQLEARSAQGLEGADVQRCWSSGLASLALDKCPRVPFAWRRAATRWADADLGRTAGALARRSGAALLSYSYYGSSAFPAYRAAGPALLFQLHPHPAAMRAILSRELAEHPDCAASLQKEWELALPEADYQRLLAETRMARHWLAASSFTKRTLVEQGVPAEAVDVIPYGVDTGYWRPQSGPARAGGGPLRLLFAGTINQRKGIKYLLEALRLLRGQAIELTVCGRPVDDLSLFRPFASQVRLRLSVSRAELLKAYQQADLFVFPSVAEGFAQVLLEALACGLPVLSTTHTAAPDLLTEGVDGFVVEPRRPDLLAERIAWALGRRGQLREMRREARKTAERFTWARFRLGVVSAVRQATQAAAGAPQADEAPPAAKAQAYV